MVSKLSGDSERAITVQEFNALVDEINVTLAQGLAEAAAVARDGRPVIADLTTGAAIDSVLAVPAAYSAAYFKQTIATLLTRINALVRTQAALGRMN